MRRSDQSGGEKKNGKEKTRSRISNFAGKSVNPRNQLRRLRRAKGSRDFSQGLNRAWPPERKREIFFFLPFAPSREVARRYLAATCTRPSRRKSGKRNIARGRKWRGVKAKKKTGDYANEEFRVGKKYTRTRIEGIPRAPFPIVFISSAPTDPFPSAFAQPETARVRNRGKSELIVGKTPFSPRPAGVTRTSGGAPLSLPSPLSIRVNG